MTDNSVLRSKLHAIFDRTIDEILKTVRDHFIGDKVKPVQFLPPKPKKESDSKRVLIQMVSEGYRAQLPDGRIWNRKRERDLILIVKKAGYIPFSFRSGVEVVR